MPTCANCGGLHTANYSQCPSLLGYLAKRNSLASRNIGFPKRLAHKALNTSCLSSSLSPFFSASFHLSLCLFLSLSISPCRPISLSISLSLSMSLFISPSLCQKPRLSSPCRTTAKLTRTSMSMLRVWKFRETRAGS
ncbi:hypothetical protein WH47_03082 [Habropoda laboriosa]|uniref:Uncharacterized protein n=1 Tax=Habropoda laboriosa TaxID=597456 RepID=A0A0L7QY81_9HYME|nr:hypothetical protein WH47_03082 [Habropoda laboriosa]